MTNNIRIQHNTGSGYRVLHPETNVNQVLDSDGKRLSEVIEEITNSENIIIGEIEGITSNTLQGAIDELVTTVNSGSVNSGDVLMVSHKTPAQSTSPVSLQLNRGFTAGTAYDSISLVEDTNPTTNLITSKTASTISTGSGFGDEQSIINLLVENGLIPNKNYTGNIPLEALKDADGNDIAGAYVFKFRTKSIIAEAGSLLNLVANVNDEGTEVSVSWTNPQGVDLVNIIGKRDTAGYVENMNEGTTVYNALGTSFVDDNVVLNTEYYYTLFTIDSVGEFNNTSRIKVLVEESPLTLIVTPGTSMIKLNEVIPTLPIDSEILFTEGNFDLDSRIIINRSNITLRGTSGTVLTKTKDITTETQGMIHIADTENDHAYLNDIKLINLRLNGNYQSDSADSNNFDGYGIYVYQVGPDINSEYSHNSSIIGLNTDPDNGVLIKNCTVEYFWDGAILLYASTACTLTGNVVQHIGYPAIRIENSYCNNVTNNLIQDITNTGIYVLVSSDNNINNNTIRKTTDVGMFLYNSSNNTINGNILRDNAYGMHVEESHNNTLFGNVLQLQTESGVTLSYSIGNVLSGNVIKESTTQGIVVTNSSMRNIITGNTLSNGSDVDIEITSDCNENVVCNNQTNGSIDDSGVDSLVEFNVEY